MRGGESYRQNTAAQLWKRPFGALAKLGWMMGLEPTTTGITSRGSTIELHPPYNWRAWQGSNLQPTA